MNKKTSSSSLSSSSSNISRRKAKRNLDRNARSARRRGSNKQRRPSAYALEYQNLEERLPLDASFVFNPADGQLDFSVFTSDTAGTPAIPEVPAIPATPTNPFVPAVPAVPAVPDLAFITLGTTAAGTFTATLTDGNWIALEPVDDMGDPNPDNADIGGIGTQTLTLSNDLLSILTVDGSLTSAAFSTRPFVFQDGGRVRALSIDDVLIFDVEQVELDNADNEFNQFTASAIRDVTVASSTAIGGGDISGANITLTGAGATLGDITATPFFPPNFDPLVDPAPTADVNISFTGDLNVSGDVLSPTSISIQNDGNANIAVNVGGDLGNADTIDVDIDAGSINIENLRTDTVDLDTTTGSITIQDAVVRTLGSVVFDSEQNITIGQYVGGTATGGALELDANGTLNVTDENVGLEVNDLDLSIDGNATIERLNVLTIVGDTEDLTIARTTDRSTPEMPGPPLVPAVFTPVTIIGNGLRVGGNLSWDTFGSITQTDDGPLIVNDDTVFNFQFGEQLLLAVSELNDFRGSLTVNGTLLAAELAVVNNLTIDNLRTIFTSIEDDINAPDNLVGSRIRLTARGGQPVIGVPGSDTPIARDNNGGTITIGGNVISEEILIQASNGLTTSPDTTIDTFALYLGGDDENESRGEYQLNVPSLQQLSANLFDGFSITSQQAVTVGDFTYTGLDDGDPTTTADEFDDQVFTNAFSDQFASIVATELIFDSPFESQKLVADITTDISQNVGAILDIDDLHLTAQRVFLDNVNNDFQRIAAVGQGFLADNRTNNEDVFIIRDQGTLEISVLDSQPDDTVVVDFAVAIPERTLAGISVAGEVDIQTGLGNPAPVSPEGAVEPTAEQLGNTVDNPTQFQIETFEVPRDRSGTQTGVFRDDAYNGAVRPVYYIEFVYDGTQDLIIETDQFERGNPEPVRDFIDIELALYNNEGQIVALGDDIAVVLERIEFAAGTLPEGRYFVAASAFSTEFEDDFVVRTANVQTGTLNVTIRGNVAVTPETSRDLTQAVGAPLIVLGGDEPIPDDELFEEDPNDFLPEDLIQLDPNADDFVPERRRRDPIGDLLPETDGRAFLSAANGGSVQLGIVDDNDIRELIINGAEGVEFVDTNDLTVTSLDTPGQSRLASGRGGDGVLTLGNISSGTLLLQSPSGVQQEGILDTPQLLLGGDSALTGGGDFVILSDTLENLAFNLPAGNLALTTSQELTLAFEQFTDPENELAPRFIFNDSFVSGTARIEAAGINVNTRVEAETLILNVTDSIIQSPAIEVLPNFDPELIPSIPSIVATSLSVSATTVTLDQTRNEITRLAGNVTGTGDAFSLVNRTPVVFSTIDNTVEAITRLRPIGVTQNFGPLTTINGLTVAGLANIVSGLEPDDPTASSLSVVTINPVVVSDDDGSNTAEFFGNAEEEAEIKRLIDVIYLQAGVDIEFLPTQFWNNTFANVGDGTEGDDGERPRADLGTILTTGDAAGFGSPDPLVIDLYAVSLNPGFPPAIGLAFVGAPGTTIQVTEGRPTTANGRALTAVLAAHEIGHNLGLGHVDGIPNLLNPFIFASPPAVLTPEQAAIIQASPLSSEPDGILGGFTQEEGAPLNIGTANFTVVGEGDIILQNPENDVTFVETDARDVSVTLVDESVVVGITADREVLIEGVGSLTVENANSLVGNVTINAADDILIGSIAANPIVDVDAPDEIETADGTITITSTNGSINDFQNNSLVNLAASGTITLNANDGIGNLFNPLDFADQAVVDATSATSNIAFNGLGTLTLQNLEATVGLVNVAAGDVLVGAIFAGETIDINSADGINDLQDDLIADFTASGLVNLVAVNEIGGMASPQEIDTGGRLEAAFGTLISTTGGNISVGGDGDLSFQDLITTEAVDISTNGDLTIANLMAFSATLNANNLTVDTTKTVDFVDFTSFGNMDLGTVMATSIALTSNGLLDAESLMASTGNIFVDSFSDANIGEATATLGSAFLNAGTNLTTGDVTATLGTAQLFAGFDLFSTNVTAGFDATLNAGGTLDSTLVTAGQSATLTTITGDLNSATVEAGALATLGSGAALTSDVVVAGSASLTATGLIDSNQVTANDGSVRLQGGDLISETVDATGDATLIATNSFSSDSVTAAGLAILNAGGLLDSETVTAGSAFLSSSDSIESGSVTANVDDAVFIALNNITAATVTAQGPASLTATLGDITITESITSATDTVSLIAGGQVDVAELNSVAIFVSTGEDVSFGDIDVVEDVSIVSLGAIDTGSVIGSAVTLNAATTLVAGNVTARTDGVSLSGQESLTAGIVTADSGAASLESGGLLLVDAVDAVSVTTNTVGNTRITEITADEALTVNSGGTLAVTTANVGSADIETVDNVTFETLNSTNGALLNSTSGRITADTIASTAGAVNLTAAREVNAQNVSGALDVTFNAGREINSTSVISTAGSVDLLANANLNVNNVDAAVDATVNAPNSNVFAESVTAGNVADLNAGAFLFTRAVEATTATMTAGTNQVAHQVLADTATITADLDLRLNRIDAQTLTLVAGDDILDIAFGDGNRVTTSDLTLVAGNSVDEVTFGGIVLETDVDTLSATVEGSGFGNLIIREFDAVQLGTITAGNGRIFIAANGTISGGDISTVTQNNENDVRLDAVGDTSDVAVNSINVGALGDVTLLAGDDVIIPSAGAVTADFVFALARNRTASGEDGIRLGTNIVRTDLVVGIAEDANQSRGDIVIQDAGSFTLNFARTLSGTISATANGNLIANVAQAEGVTADDSIHLRAIGSGSDVITSRVVVRNQTGGVLIEADDDIRDGNSGDNLQVIANSVSYVAGNNVNDNFNGIIGQSRVKTLSARVNSASEANIFLFNQGTVRLNEAVLSTGTISVTNRLGTMTVDRAETTTDSPDNLVRLATTGANADLLLADVDAGSRGRVSLDSGDDIFDTDLLDDLFVTGGFLSVTSRNGSLDSFDGIILNADVDRFVADAQRNGAQVIRNRRV